MNSTISTFTFCYSRAAGHRVGEHLERIVPLITSFCRIEDDELREYCLQAFESFVRRCPKQISPHINTVRNKLVSQIISYHMGIVFVAICTFLPFIVYLIK